ncbi:protein tyrosine phosphatase [Tianweitania sp. BSSL-BM11]|uniref:Protein tyrosine phosphatase n=1 Tax=Tianweitania aestuarii TaxID=2814886 RepID=A0ABS5RU69_9HYPH|nr:protein tyrosine phosphatase [Tianweitania aestuarii]MBS9720603.1 protein tyrosine phosphatase [Tianweitania aestuarii]
MIHVTPLSHLPETLAASKARRVISLQSIGATFERPAGIEPDDYLQLAMHDIAEEREGYVAPSREQVAAILAFGERVTEDDPILIHCYAGISRSTAAAYVIAAALRPGMDEQALAQVLRRLSPSATPNPRIVALADALLGREGRMIAAIRAIGRGAEAFAGTPFVLLENQQED